jgi:ABC-type transporter Mla maintaining outer membrane lipid asymmetry ATPase subunit MlaF
MKTLFSAADLKYSLRDLPVLRGVSFQLSEGEALIIGGRSGCGKSTLLEICASLLSPEAGKVFWEGHCIADLTREELTTAKQRIGFIFQKHALIHNFTIFDNIALPLRYHSTLPEKDIQIQVRQCMEEVGLFDVDYKFPNELSSSQSKCAALARALIMKPHILFADEPTAGVDPYTETCITNVIENFRSLYRPAVLMACNDKRTIEHMKSPIKILDNGKLMDIGASSAGSEDYQSAILTTFQEML